MYIKGTPGSGKSTIREELAKRGYEAHDADDRDMGGPFNNEANQPVTYPDNPSKAWFAAHSYRLIPEAIQNLHTKAKTKTIFLCGTAHNEDDLWSLFDKIIFLDIDEETLLHRIATRTNNDYGKAPHERKLILEKYHHDRTKRDRPGVISIDATKSLDQVIYKILEITQ